MKLAFVMVALAGLGLMACNRADTAPVKRVSEPAGVAPGTVVIAPQFASASDFVDGLALVEVGTIDDKLRGYIDTKGKFRINPKYRYARDFSEGLAAVEVSAKGEAAMWGFIDTTGKIVIEPQLGAASKFEDGLTVVTVGVWPNGVDGLLDKRGRFAVNPQFRSVYRLGKDRYFYTTGQDSLSGMMDATGKPVGEPKYSLLNSFREGVAPAAFGKKANDPDVKCGYIDAAGKVVIEPQFMRCEKFSDGVARVAAIVDGVGGWGYIDHKGQFIIKPGYQMADDFHEGLAAVAVGPSEDAAKWGFIGKSGALVIPVQFDEQYAFVNGLAVVRVGGGFGTQKSSELMNTYDRSKPVKAGKWGAIDKQGKFVVNPVYDLLEAPREGLAPMRTGDHLTGKWGYIAL